MDILGNFYDGFDGMAWTKIVGDKSDCLEVYKIWIGSKLQHFNLGFWWIYWSNFDFLYYNLAFEIYL